MPPTGMPAFGDGVFQNFIGISAQAACVHTILTPDNCAAEMERVIATAMANRQPAYIMVAQDMAEMPITGPAVEPYPELESDTDELKAAVEAALGPRPAAFFRPSPCPALVFKPS